jgi:hypothetical protein
MKATTKDLFAGSKASTKAVAGDYKAAVRKRKRKEFFNGLKGAYAKKAN